MSDPRDIQLEPIPEDELRERIWEQEEEATWRATVTHDADADEIRERQRDERDGMGGIGR